MIDIRRQPASHIVLVSILIAASGIQLLMIATMPIITTFDTATLLGGVGTYPLPGFPLFAAATGVVKFDTIIYFLACQGVLAVSICLAPVHLALHYARPLVATALGIVLSGTLVPFVFSLWLMTDHLYMFSLVALVWCYGMLLLSGQWRYAISFGAALWLAQITRPTGAVLCVVVVVAVAISLLANRELMVPRLSRFAVASIILGVLLLISGYFLSPPTNSEGASDWKGRWLFCQIYSQSGVKGHTPVTLEHASSLNTIAATLRQKLAGNPPLLTTLISRWPEYFDRYKGDGARLTEDIVYNRQPMNDLAEHKFCWVIFSVLDDAFGVGRANTILVQAWEAFLWAHPSVIGSIYVPQLVSYFLMPPDYSHATWFSNDIGISRLGPHVYSEIYGIGVQAENSTIFRIVCRYVFSVYMFLTPILSILALLSFLIVFSSRPYAPVLLLCFGIVLYHGLATAISNVVTIRYVFVVYPEMISLAVAGVFVAISIVKRAQGIEN